MKIKLITLVGLAAWSLAGFAQSTPPAGVGSGPAASANAAPDAAAAAAPASPGQAVAEKPAANAQAGQATAEKPAADAQATPAQAPAAADVTQAQQAAADTAAPAAGAAATDAKAQPNALIPLIVMDDVPLTDAIKNLARQAGLNYMLDPKVAFGQVGPDGKPVPQPTVSVRWENVTAEQALTALLGNYNLQLTEDPKSKIARVTVKDPAAPDPLVTKIIQLKYAHPTNMVGAVQNLLVDDKRSKVVADVRTSQLVVLATEKQMIEVDQLIERLDTITRQVLIEGRLLETQINPTTIKGVDWGNTLRGQNLSFGNNLQNKPVQSGDSSARPGSDTSGLGGTTTTSGGVATTLLPVPGGPLATLWPKMFLDTARGFNPATAFLDADGVSAVLSFLNTYAETKVISAPRTVTLDNEMSTIEVGTMFPIVNTTAGTANTTGGSQISYSNLTVRLEVTPRISANNYVNLKVLPKILRLGDLVTSVVGDQKNAVYSFQKREIATSVLIPSGNTLVMGGLIEDNVHKENSKVPLLGDIPGFGYLFRHDLKQRTKSNLMVFLTPTIVQDSDFQPTKSDFLKNPVPKSDSVEDDWGSWDSGKPRDWSAAKTPDNSKFADLPAKKDNTVAIPADNQSAHPQTQTVAQTPAAPKNDATTSNPDAAAAKPEAAAQQPEAATEAASQQPDAPAQQPEAATQQPASATQPEAAAAPKADAPAETVQPSKFSELPGSTKP